MGVLQDVLANSGEPGPNMTRYMFVSGYENHDLLFDYPTRPGTRGVGIARSAFLDALVKYFNTDDVEFKKRCVDVSPSPQNPSRYLISFSDGSTHEADVVIGADGIKSTVRSYISGIPSNESVAFSNTYGYRAMISYEEAKAAGLKTDFNSGLRCFVGKNKHFITYLIRGGRVINIVAFVTVTSGGAPAPYTKLPPNEPWVTPATKEEVLLHFEEFGDDVKAMIKCMHNVNKWSIHLVHPTLDSYAKGAVALVGDSAHAMYTHLGAGASQGLEDCYILARLLGHEQAKSSNLDAIIKEYDRLRRPRAQMVWDRSEYAGDVIENRGLLNGSAAGITQDLTGIWDPIWYHDLSTDVEDGVRRLQEMGAFT